MNVSANEKTPKGVDKKEVSGRMPASSLKKFSGAL
jgi:hypothetical protein